MAIHENPNNNSVHTAHWYTTLRWLAGFMKSSVRVECHLAVWMKSWGLGTIFEIYLNKLLLQVQKLWYQIFV